jgi:hypothetical protein
MHSFVGLAVRAAALGLVAFGIACVFAGDEVAGRFGIASAEPFASLLGGALVGLGAANWMVRGSLLGGIYGRAIVTGNQVHFVVGAAALLRRATGAQPPAFWALTAFYVAGAVLFSYLLLFARGVPRPEGT